MDDYWEDDYDIPCPHCGNPFTRWQDCNSMYCEDGEVDLYEHDDPLWYDPGDVETCSECHGYGRIVWCPDCGRDLTVELMGQADDEDEEGDGW